MKTSIEKRIKIIIGVSLLLVVLMGGVTLYYFSEINSNIETLIGTDIKMERVGQKLKASYFDLRSAEREYIYFLRTGYETDSDKKTLDKIKERLTNYFSAIKDNIKQSLNQSRIDLLNKLEKNLKDYEIAILEVETTYLQSKNVPVKQVALKLLKLREEQDNLVNQILSLGSQSFLSHQNYMDHLISNANRNLVFLITLALLAGLIIIYLAPQKVTEPIKNYVNAIKELRELKFETRLPVSEKNELSELGTEINKFVDAFIDFDDMKRKKIQFEKRKSQVLADILNLGVVIISIEGEVLFLNAQMAKVLNLSTESFQKKDFHFVRLPDEIKDLFEDAILKKEKFENRMVILTYQKEDENGELQEETVELLVDAGVVRNYVGDVANVILTFEDISDSPQDSIFKRISFSKPVSL